MQLSIEFKKKFQINYDYAEEILDVANNRIQKFDTQPYSKTNKEFEKIFKKLGNKAVDHQKGKWNLHKKNFGGWYPNIDEKHKRALFNYWKLPVEENKFLDRKEQMEMFSRGLRGYEIYPFETQLLHKCCIFYNNNGLDVLDYVFKKIGANFICI